MTDVKETLNWSSVLMLYLFQDVHVMFLITVLENQVLLLLDKAILSIF